MATQPEFPPPDTIEPHSPPESPPSQNPMEAPFCEPPEIIPEVPDQNFPGRESDRHSVSMTGGRGAWNLTRRHDVGGCFDHAVACFAPNARDARSLFRTRRIGRLWQLRLKYTISRSVGQISSDDLMRPTSSSTMRLTFC